MTEISAGYVIGGFLALGVAAMTSSLCGIVAVLPLNRRASQFHGTIYISLIDCCCLTAIVGALSTFIWNLFPDGDKTDGFIYVLAICLPQQDSDVFGLVVITTGGNDLIHNYGRLPPKECAMYGATLTQAATWIESFKERLDTILDTIISRFPGGCEIYLANIYDPTDGVGDAPSVYLPHWPDGIAIHAQYNRKIAECAAVRPNVHVVPLYESFLGHGSHCRQFWRSTYDRSDPYYWYFDNVEDPNDRGYDAIRRLFLNTILEHSAIIPRETETTPLEQRDT